MDTPFVFTSNVTTAGSSNVYVAVTRCVTGSCVTVQAVICGSFGSANATSAVSAPERIKNDFASKVTCPVYDGYPYGHMSLSRTIDFLREKTIFEDGVMRQ